MKTTPDSFPARAFTLVELLVVIAILTILIALLLHALKRIRDSAQLTACLSNMRQISTAVFLYASENKGHLPHIPSPQHSFGDGASWIMGGPSPAHDDGTGRGVSIDGWVPAPQNRALNKYLARGGYGVFQCPSDQGVDIREYWPEIAWVPRMWEFTGTSYCFNDYQKAYHASVDESDYRDTPWNKRLEKLPRRSQFILVYEPPAQVWPWGFGAAAGTAGKVFRWHSARSGSGSRTYPAAGNDPFISNVAFADGHAETIDFTASYRRDENGYIAGQDRTARLPWLWYIPQLQQP